MTACRGVEIMKNGSEKMVTARAAAVIAVLLMIVAFGSWGIQAGSAPVIASTGAGAGGGAGAATTASGSGPAVATGGGSHFVRSSSGAPKADGQSVASDGSLQVVDKDGNAGLFCPLKH